MTTQATATCEECGWTGGPYKTAGTAAYAATRHQCATHRKREARHQARIEREAAAGEEQSCTHDTHHPHGSRSRYVLDKCRCHPCKVATREYEQQRRRTRAYGQAAYVDAQPARSHVQQLQAAGMGWKRIAKAAGLSTSVVWALLYGKTGRGTPPTKRVRPTTADSLLAVQLNLAPGVTVDGTGTRRRLQALVWAGYSITHQARLLGWTPSNLWHVAGGTCGVAHATAQQVADLYDRLALTPNRPTEWHAKAAATRARNYARQHGWVSALAWVDDSIDDPNAQPHTGTGGADPADVDEQAITRAILTPGTVTLTRAERLELIRRLAARGRPDRYIALRAGVTPRTVQRIRAIENIESRWAA